MPPFCRLSPGSLKLRFCFTHCYTIFPINSGTFFDSAEYPESDEKDAKKENEEHKENETSSGEAVVNGEDETSTTTSAEDEKGEVEGPEEEKNECSNSGDSEEKMANGNINGKFQNLFDLVTRIFCYTQLAKSLVFLSV